MLKFDNSLKPQHNFAIILFWLLHSKRYKKIIVPKIPPGGGRVYSQLKVWATALHIVRTHQRISLQAKHVIISLSEIFKLSKQITIVKHIYVVRYYNYNFFRTWSLHVMCWVSELTLQRTQTGLDIKPLFLVQ